VNGQLHIKHLTGSTECREAESRFKSLTYVPVSFAMWFVCCCISCLQTDVFIHQWLHFIQLTTSLDSTVLTHINISIHEHALHLHTTQQCQQHYSSVNGITSPGATSHMTHYRSFWGQLYTGQMTQPTVSQHWRTMVSQPRQGPILPGSAHQKGKVKNISKKII